MTNRGFFAQCKAWQKWCIVSMILAAAGAHAGQEAAGDSSYEWTIHWEIANPFPLLPKDRVDALRDMRGSSPLDMYYSLAKLWSPGKPLVADVETTMYDRATGKYKQGYVKHVGEAVEALFRVQGPEVASARCHWAVERNGEVLEVLPEAPCETQVRISIPLDVEVEVRTTIFAGGRNATVRCSAKVRQKVVVALGDSYASGEGNPDIPAVYNFKGESDGRDGVDWPFSFSFDEMKQPGATWWDRECHRSLASWPVMSTLWMALDDEAKQTRHVILTYACSGALIDDGGFLAQLKSGLVARNKSYYRDGDSVQSEEGQRLVFSTQRSQVNAMYDDLCRGQARRHRLVTVEVPNPVRAWVETCESMTLVDDLLISMGGNDLGFAGIAMGVIIPSDSRPGLLTKPALLLIRKMIGATPIEDAREQVVAYSKHYAMGIKQLITAAGVNPERTSVVAYPNPVVSDERDDGCIGSDSRNQKERAQRNRVRDVNLVFSPILQQMSKHLITRGWTVELKASEVKAFRDVFAAIEGMQRDAFFNSDLRGVTLTAFGDQATFKGRRMCDAVYEANVTALPLHFCEGGDAGKRRTCDVADAMGGGQWNPRSAFEWRQYPKPQEPKRIIVNWMNDALLAGRTWQHNPTLEEIAEAIAGAVHPTAEAHAAAATEVVKGWQSRRDGAQTGGAERH